MKSFFIFVLFVSSPCFSMQSDPEFGSHEIEKPRKLQRTLSNGDLPHHKSEPKHRPHSEIFTVDEIENGYPPLSKLVNLKEACGLNLSLVIKRQEMVRIAGGGVDSEPTVDIVNLATTFKWCPSLARLSWTTVNRVVELSFEKESLQLLANRRAVKRTSKIDQELKALLNGAVTPDGNLLTVCNLVKAVQKVKSKIVMTFGPFGLTMEHLEQLPRRDLWEQELHEFAKKARSPSAKDLHPKRIAKGIKKLEGIYGDLSGDDSDSVSEVGGERRRFATITRYNPSEKSDDSAKQKFLEYFQEKYGNLEIESEEKDPVS